jgi:hypothetical protein
LTYISQVILPLRSLYLQKATLHPIPLDLLRKIVILKSRYRHLLLGISYVEAVIDESESEIGNGYGGLSLEEGREGGKIEVEVGDKFVVLDSAHVHVHDLDLVRESWIVVNHDYNAHEADSNVVDPTFSILSIEE